MSLTFDVVVDDFVRVQVLQPTQDLLGHPDDLELPHGPAAVQLLQDRAAFPGLHEQVDGLVPEHGAVQLRDVLMAESGLELHIGCFEVLNGDLWGRKIEREVKINSRSGCVCSI